MFIRTEVRQKGSVQLDILVSHYYYVHVVTEGQHEASVQPDHGASVPTLHQTGQVQEAAPLALLPPLRAALVTQVPYARMEHRLRVKRLRL